MAISNFSYLYETYKRAVVRVTIRTNDGDLSTGSAFHIGDGWLATAAHVILRGSLYEVIAEGVGNPLNVERILTHSDPNIDLGLIKTNFNLSHYLEKTTIHNPPDGFVKTDRFLVGGHLDDWIGDELVLSKVLLMGYPPVPFSNAPILLAAEGEVNAVIDKYNGPHPHFIVSCMGRGGFSGGPVLSEHGFLLGVVTESLVMNNQPEELGYTAAISVEPLLTMLYEHKIYPGSSRETLEVLFGEAGHWDTKKA
ncbi:MAG: serine protease [Methanoregula sp.]|jgi:CBS domain-containing protein